MTGRVLYLQFLSGHYSHSLGYKLQKSENKLCTLKNGSRIRRTLLPPFFISVGTATTGKTSTYPTGMPSFHLVLEGNAGLASPIVTLS